jgi:hypothetical protein
LRLGDLDYRPFDIYYRPNTCYRFRVYRIVKEKTFYDKVGRYLESGHLQLTQTYQMIPM